MGVTFSIFLAARVLIGVSSTMLSVAIGWHLYSDSGNPFDLALVGLVQVLPMLGLFILSGWVVDLLIVFGLLRELWLSMAALWVYGAADMISVNLRSTLIQLATPDTLRGRVSAVNTIFISASNELGDFRAGSVAGLFGPIPTVLIGGGVAAAVAIGGAITCPQLRRLKQLTDAQVESENERN